MIQPRTVFLLGVSQLVCWGISYYLIGGFSELIAADLGWGLPLVHGGFSAALLVMGLSSPITGALIDRYGGARVMTLGSGLIALGCAGLALSHSLLAYYAAWICLGLAMRLTLYDAAFAALARIAGPEAGRPIAQITLLGGLASTVFWPIGNLLAEALGWRGAVFVYAGIAVLTVPLHLAIPPGRFERPANAPEDPPPPSRADERLAGLLYAVIAMLTNFLNSGMSAHMIGILAGLGLATSLSVWIATLRGIGQSAARLSGVLFGGRIPPLTLNMIAASALPISFLAGLFSGGTLVAAVGFAFLYGAGNGIATITRGTMPLVLFDNRRYWAITGKLLMPGFMLSALAPLAYALVIEHWGPAAALLMSVLAALITLAASITLFQRFGRQRQR